MPIINFAMSNYDSYILLTHQMNPIVNPKNKPYLIMEGLVDINMNGSTNDLSLKKEENILIYAGGLFKKYGVENLILSFMQLKNQALRLHLYGNGDMIADINLYAAKDNRISYKGVVPNAIVVQDQLTATLLINPRPTSEEFTKYSFPSKNMEYMVSGTPMVTTILPGMPLEYHEFVYLFLNETVEGMTETLVKISPLEFT